MFMWSMYAIRFELCDAVDDDKWDGKTMRTHSFFDG